MLGGGGVASTQCEATGVTENNYERRQSGAGEFHILCMAGRVSERAEIELGQA